MTARRQLAWMILLLLPAALLSGCTDMPVAAPVEPSENSNHGVPTATRVAPVEDGAAVARGHVATGLALKENGSLEEAIREYSAALELDSSFAEAYLRRGQAHAALEQLDAAVADYDRAITLDSSCAEAYHSRGAAQLDLGHPQAAIEDLRRAVELNPELAAGFEDRAMAREELGDLNGAMEDYSRAIALEPDNGRTYTNRAVARRKLGDVAGAIADHSRAIELLPDTPKKAIPFFNRGNALRAQGDLDGAVADFTRAIELDPEFAPAYTNRAGIVQANDVQAAMRDYNRALELPLYEEAYAIALAGRGFLYLRSGSLSAASRDFARAIEVNPDYARAHAGQGYVALAQGKLPAAIERFDRAIALDPQSSEAYLGRAGAHEASARIDLAFDDMMRGLSLLADDKEKASAYGKLGSARAVLGDWERAALAWTEAIKLGPTSQLHADRGLAYMRKGAFAQAAADFRAAVSLGPDNAAAHANLAWVLAYHLDANFEEALEHARRAVEISPDAVRYDTLALALQKIGQFQEALKTYEKALQLNPLQAGSYRRRGDVHRELGDAVAAQADYQQYLKLAPQAEDRVAVEALVRSMLGQ